MKSIVTLVSLSTAFLITVGEAKDIPPDEFVLDNSKSPNGRYAVAIRFIGQEIQAQELARGDDPPDNTSPFLIRLKPRRVIREIARSLRDFRPHPENDYECFWKHASSMLAVVFLEHSGSELSVLENRRHQWRNLPLPEVHEHDYDAPIARHSKIGERIGGKWFIDSVAFSHGKIAVTTSGEIMGDRKTVDAHIHYLYLNRRGRWIARMEQINVDTD